MIDPLQDFRQSIDNLDTALMFLLAERCRTIAKVALIKKQKHLPFEYSDERKGDLAKTFEVAKANHLNFDFIAELFKQIYKEALNIMSRTLETADKSNTKLMSLENLRASIYHLDIALCHILAERFDIVTQIRQYKQSMKIPPLISKRFHDLLTKKKEIAKNLGINVDFTTELFHLIHQESLRIQREKE